MEGVTHGIRDYDKKVTIVDGKVQEEGEGDTDASTKIKYKIKTKYGQVPVYEKKVALGKSK